MQIEVKKTDKRHTGSDRFKYYVDIKWTDYAKEHKLVMEKFFEIRQWCWETWGPSREVDQYSSKEGSWTADQNLSWSWINDQHRARIYLGSKDEAAFFTLKWA
jgi:hypothetical protein